MAIALDTSVVVAALLSWHEEHDWARSTLEDLLTSEEEILLPMRVVVEAYSVMTRLPSPHRLAPRDAWQLLDESFKSSSRLIGLTARQLWQLLESLAEHCVAGGAAYDAEIIECAARGAARAIVTLNRQQFERLAPDELEVLGPR